MNGQTMWSWIRGTVLYALVVLDVSAATDSVLLCYDTNVLRYAVQDGVWEAQGEFANRIQSYGGIVANFGGLTSDGRSVFVGEKNAMSSRILEFDLQGNYRRVLTTVGYPIEYMCTSCDGRWLYVAADPWSTAIAIYRYDAVLGTGGLFISNTGSNEVGTVLWTLNVTRGVAADENGVLWVSSRGNGTVYKFRETDGAYLGVVSGLTNIQGLSYSAADKKIYGSSVSLTAFAIDTTTGAATKYSISNLGNRLGISEVGGSVYSGLNDGPAYIVRYGFNNLTISNVLACPVGSRQMITLPHTSSRETIGHLLVSETVSNRVARLSVDSGYAVDRLDTFVGGGALYADLPLREPRGLAAFSNTVYVAEGVEGGRVLRFNKWGTFKEVTVDFTDTPYSNCVPAALALAPDGETLYVSDAHTLFLVCGGVTWANVPTNGYYGTNGFGETVYKVNVRSHDVSVFANAANCVSGNTLLEPHGVAVDVEGNVYCTAWFNRTNAVYTSLGTLYKFAPDGTRLATLSINNPTVCCYDPLGSYHPVATNGLISGAGVLFTGYGMQDFWWTSAGSAMSAYPKLLDLNNWRNYLDAEVLDGRMWFTDPEYGVLWRRSGETTCEAVLSDLHTPSYLTYVPETGSEPAPSGTIIRIY